MSDEHGNDDARVSYLESEINRLRVEMDEVRGAARSAGKHVQRQVESRWRRFYGRFYGKLTSRGFWFRYVALVATIGVMWYGFEVAVDRERQRLLAPVCGVSTAMETPNSARSAYELGQSFRSLQEFDTDIVRPYVDAKMATLGEHLGLFVLGLRAKPPEPERISKYEMQPVAITDVCGACPTGAISSETEEHDGDRVALTRRVAQDAGFTGVDLDIAVQVAGAESAHWADAEGQNTDSHRSVDRGLWQINSHWNADKFSMGDWRDPAVNARMAFAVWKEGGWDRWTTYRSGAYLKHPTGAESADSPAQDAEIAPVAAGVTPGTVFANYCSQAETPHETDPFIAVGNAPGGWGGHENGKIPAVALQPLATAPGQSLRADAARAFDEMSRAHQSDVGRPLSVTDSYRTLAEQHAVAREKGLYKNGGLAAVPGTSNHGWGLAVDLDLNAESQRWMRANGARYGFKEDTAREPWHWAFYGAAGPVRAG